MQDMLPDNAQTSSCLPAGLLEAVLDACLPLLPPGLKADAASCLLLPAAGSTSVIVICCLLPRLPSTGPTCYKRK
jgi:hypothetical protein